MKKLALIVGLCGIVQASFAVDCEFIPLGYKVGAYNIPNVSKENNFIVCADAALTNCYNLGLVTNELAKARYSATLLAFTSGKRIRLRFPGESSCANAAANFPAPSEAIFFSWN